MNVTRTRYKAQRLQRSMVELQARRNRNGQTLSTKVNSNSDHLAAIFDILREEPGADLKAHPAKAA